MKQSVVLIALLGLAFGGLAYTVNSALDKAEVIKADSVAVQELEAAEANAGTNLVNTVSDYNALRTFDIFYGDTDRLSQILSGLSGIEIRNVYDVIPEQNYADAGFHTEGSETKAIRYELLVTDVSQFLSVLGTMELPLVSLDVVLPNQVSVVFLTGGTV